ncbi:MAG: SufD family Fe-S cluster assembly protein [Alphaproteobacteria bacterium]|nr:SufD family Fe-S cluster assembly protein [Alphaproteobacteria bacterium]
MSYLWQEFNIKTFSAETLVFRDGVFIPELSDYKNIEISENNINIKESSILPIHIIYIGEIAGNFDININIYAENTKIFMTNKTIAKKPAFLNIFVKNYGENSVFDGQIIIQNHKNLKIDVKGEHFSKNTGILIKTKVMAYENSDTELNGYAIINKDLKDCDSNISFSVMADKNTKIKLKPTQYIKSIPLNATHSASLYNPNQNQINYLSESGLSSNEIQELLKEAFLSQE